MQMQEGIGRGGYRLLAIVFAGVGALGIITTLVAFQSEDQLQDFFRWLGFALTTFALVALLALVLVILAPARTPRAARQAQPEPVVELLDEVPEATGSMNDPGVEFDDAEPAPETPASPAPRGPPARVQPAPVPFGQPRSVSKDTKGWPSRKEPTGVTRREMAESTFVSTESSEQAARAKAGAKEPALVMARTAASAEAAGLPDNVSVGKCGNCGVLLMAPKKRPIRLQCPRCERIHTLA